MPELPEVETVRRSLLPHVIGQSVIEVWARNISLRAGIEPAEWANVRGRACREIERRGKYLIAHFDEFAAVIHLGMSGRLMVVPRDSDTLPHTHLRLRLASDGELRYVDPRRFGMAVVISAGELSNFAPLRILGPDPLKCDMGVLLVQKSKKTVMPIRNLLLDQRVVAGIGNIYANESLAKAGIRPDRPSNKIDKARILRLASSIRNTLKNAITAGGTTLKDGGFVNGVGDDGYFAIQLSVYGREGQACPTCGRAILRASLSGRSLFYCPSCQR